MEIAALVCFGWIISVCLHEWGHAIVAYFGGDTSVKDKGYLTLNMFKYTDPGLSLFFPVLILMLGGIALPGAAVYIDHSRLRSRLWESAVSAAGPAMSLLVCVLLAAPWWLHMGYRIFPDWVYPGLAFLVQLQAFSVILNMMPIPPCDGAGIIEPWLPGPMRQKFIQFGRFGIWGIFLLLWFFPPVNELFWSLADALTTWLGVPPALTVVGFRVFQKQSGWLVIALLACLFLMRGKKQQPKPTSDDFYAAARQLFNQNRPAESITMLDHALQMQPNFAEAWHLRALSNAMLHRNSDALDNFDRAIRINPGYTDCWYNKACCLALQGHDEQALDNLRQAIQLNPVVIREHARQDVGFQKLWQDERFQKLVRS